MREAEGLEQVPACISVLVARASRKPCLVTWLLRIQWDSDLLHVNQDHKLPHLQGQVDTTNQSTRPMGTVAKGKIYTPV